MRERIAIGISVLVVVLLVALSTVFAATQNPEERRLPVVAPRADAPAAPEAADSARGRQVFQAHGCERCHSVAGVGSPRYPLDGIGGRRERDELYAWTVADEAVLDSLSPSAARAKRRYVEMPQEEMEALLDYMSTLMAQR
jgi:cytochrome c5